MTGFPFIQNRQKFTICLDIYVINELVSSKKFTNARLFTIDRFTIVRFDCIWKNREKIRFIWVDGFIFQSKSKSEQHLQHANVTSNSRLHVENVYENN